MEALREYFLSVTAAAILCACVRRFAGEKDTAGKVVKLICGLFLAFTVISPIARVKISDFALFTGEIYADAEAAAAAGEDCTKEAIADIIKTKTEAYILDKAHALGLDIEVEVQVASKTTPVPQGVRISGNVSPYAKQQLQIMLTQELGIPEEDQLWMD